MDESSGVRLWLDQGLEALRALDRLREVAEAVETPGAHDDRADHRW